MAKSWMTIPLTTMLCLILTLLITLCSANDNSNNSKVSFWHLSADQIACRFWIQDLNTYATIPILTMVLSRRLRGEGPIFPYLPPQKMHNPKPPSPPLVMYTYHPSYQSKDQGKWSNLLSCWLYNRIRVFGAVFPQFNSFKSCKPTVASNFVVPIEKRSCPRLLKNKHLEQPSFYDLA